MPEAVASGRLLQAHCSSLPCRDIRSCSCPAHCREMRARRRATHESGGISRIREVESNGETQNIRGSSTIRDREEETSTCRARSPCSAISRPWIESQGARSGGGEGWCQRSRRNRVPACRQSRSWERSRHHEAPTRRPNSAASAVSQPARCRRSGDCSGRCRSQSPKAPSPTATARDAVQKAGDPASRGTMEWREKNTPPKVEPREPIANSRVGTYLGRFSALHFPHLGQNS